VSGLAGKPAADRARKALRNAIEAAHALAHLSAAIQRGDVRVGHRHGAVRVLQQAEKDCRTIADELGRDLDRFDVHAARREAEARAAAARAAEPREPLPVPRGTCPACGGTGADHASDDDYHAPCDRCGGSGRVQVEAADVGRVST
jgi:hypothetical protein